MTRDKQFIILHLTGQVLDDKKLHNLYKVTL